MSWADFLAFLQGPGISVVVGVILSFVVEYWPKYQALEGKWKQLSFAGLSLLVPILGAAASCVSGFSAWADWGGLWWPALTAGWSAFFSGSVAHRVHTEAKRLFQ